MDIPTDDSRSIYIQMEPDAITGIRKHLLVFGKRYNHILSYDKVILNTFPHARLCLHGGCWVHKDEYEAVNIAEKMFKVSCIVGCKQETEGHTFRLQLYIQQTKLPNVIFYRSSREGYVLPSICNNPLLDTDSKYPLFKTYQFSLVIENSKQENYFTEKLIDCLITKTIPIYWGCPNIDDFFDTSGWVLLDTTTINEVKFAMESLTPDMYERYQDVIERNYETAKQYVDFHGNIRNALSAIPDY